MAKQKFERSKPHVGREIPGQNLSVGKMLCIKTSCAGLNPRPKSGNESSSAGELSIYDDNGSSFAGELSKEKELYFFEVKKRNNP